MAIAWLSACGDGSDGGDADPTPTPSATPTPSVTATPLDVARFSGVYDVSLGGDRFPAVTAASVAEVSVASTELTITFALNALNSMRLEGPLSPDGSATLSGGGILDGDIAFSATGEAQLLDANATQRVTGTYDDGGAGLPFETSFTLERSASGTPAVFAGRYRIDFDASPSACSCASHIVIAIDLSEDGVGTAVPEDDERGSGDIVLGTFEPGECLVSPSGNVQCDFIYHPASPSTPLQPATYLVTLSGRLTAGGAGVTGEGDAIGHLAPVFFTSGRWTANQETAP